MNPRRVDHLISINPDLVGSDSPSLDLLYQMERAFCNAAVEQGLGYTIIGAVDAEPPLELKSRLIRAMVRGSGFAAASTEWPKILLGRNASELCDCVLSGLEQTPDFDPDEIRILSVSRPPASHPRFD